MAKNSTSAAHRSSNLTLMPATITVRIEMRIIGNLNLHILPDRATNLLTVNEPTERTFNIILPAYPHSAQKFSGAELTKIRVEKHDNWYDHYSQGNNNSDKSSRIVKVGQHLAKGGLWSIVGFIILKIMAFCEGITGTVDFMQLVGQGFDYLLRLF